MADTKTQAHALAKCAPNELILSCRGNHDGNQGRTPKKFNYWHVCLGNLLGALQVYDSQLECVREKITDKIYDKINCSSKYSIGIIHDVYDKAEVLNSQTLEEAFDVIVDDKYRIAFAFISDNQIWLVCKDNNNSTFLTSS
jgi:hypothetical protein